MTALPVASSAEVRARARRLMARHPRELTGSLALHALAAIAGLVAPQLLGRLVQNAGNDPDSITPAVLLICVAVVAQSFFTWLAIPASLRLAEKVLADLREEFIDRVLELPPHTVEKEGTGELVTRTTRDVDVLATTVRLAVPDTLVAFSTVLLTLGAIVLTSPVLVLPCLVAVPVLWISTRWYLRRARAGYLRAGASYARLTGGLGETVDGARTVDALRLGPHRLRRVAEDIAESYAAERRTLYLRSVYLPIADTAYMLPLVATLLIGGLLHLDGRVDLAAVTAVSLYAQQIIGPVDRLLFWMDELQVGGASFARILGVHEAAGERRPESGTPASQDTGETDIVLKGVRHAYREGQDVLHGIDLVVAPGERVAVVGPSGAGKSTLGRLLAGVHAPRTGSVSIGGTDLRDLPLDQLRGSIVLVTQEHHVFRGTLRDNLLIARPAADDDALRAALTAVGAWEWAAGLGLDAEVGSGAHALAPGQAQHLALARLVLADPRAVVLDEATSLLTPHTARRLERSLATVLEGRTVVAMAHRLHTAHDADRVVVMEDGRITEDGSHDDLVRRGGAYARLWHSWHGDRHPPRAEAEGAPVPKTRNRTTRPGG
ncbi:ABC transporter ATP-binding protein [Streptomyces sp. S465]|uniref:ABC transporter ATP-binding protein n=1 Tax=Streptomyces sp. S465 TaxID=2979468 RepID=UPI0022A87F67|nr:ABC transporter ATP-binding protein [Streptomyces sp. S465]WAP60390.1 ABC transporter ATP-binding protein [Streptomyces sp. S465]